MPRFISKRVFKLDFLGAEWKDCYITFASVSIKESRELLQKKLGTLESDVIMDLTIKFLTDHFIDGVVFDADKNEVVPLKKDEIIELPNLIQEKATLFLVGDSDQ